MLVLSRDNLDDLASSIIEDFYQGKILYPDPINIEDLALEYLGLEVSYENLSSDGSILGVTAYAPCTLELPDSTVDMKANSVLLDRSLFPEIAKSSALIGRRRFTLAHECAHQILFRYESAIAQEEARKQYDCRKSFSLRELKTYEDWNEWQADTLGAALLMPEELVELALFVCTDHCRITRYGDWFPPKEYRRLDDMSRMLEVSHSALMIRLIHLGYLDIRKRSEYIDDPLEVTIY